MSVWSTPPPFLPKEYKVYSGKTLKENSMQKAIIETIKEAGRIALFAGVSALVAYATSKLSGLDPTSLYVVVGTAILRLLDKYLHENKNIQAKGLAPF